MRSATLLFLLACGPKAPPADAPGETPVESEKVEPAPIPATAPPPFSADQIREASPNGRAILLRLTKDHDVRWQRMVFTDGDEIATTVVGSEWADGDPEPDGEGGSSSWEELRDHAAFPKEGTTVTPDQTVHVPLGTFVTTRYAVDRDGFSHEFFFAPELPGPPVLAVFHGPEGDLVMEMVENKLPE